MFNFPNTPSLGDAYQPVGGPVYQWDGEKWMMSGSALIQTPAYSNRNRIVNGAMQISQENGITSVTTGYPVDQWGAAASSSSTISYRQWIAAGGGPQPYYVSISASPAETSAAAGEYVQLTQWIEGKRTNDFMLGSGTSRQFVIAFDVNVPVAGTYWVAVINSGAPQYSFLASYTISAGEVATFVRKSVVVPAGAINAGTWATDNTAGMTLRFVFHCGSTYVGVAGFQSGVFLAGPGQALGLSTASFCFLTNVGLYLDPTNSGIPPRWEMPDEAQELAACMRYWQLSGANNQLFSGNVTSGSTYYVGRILPVQMRVPPSVSGIPSAVSSFPNTTGTLTATVTGLSGFQESRVANATGPGNFSSVITANARM